MGGHSRRLPVNTLCVQGAVGDVRFDALRIYEVDAWPDDLEVVVHVMSERGPASPDQAASLSSSLLGQCQGNVPLFLYTLVFSLFSPNIWVAIAYHWFDEIKEFPRTFLLLCVMAPGAPVSVSGGGGVTIELA